MTYEQIQQENALLREQLASLRAQLAGAARGSEKSTAPAGAQGHANGGVQAGRTTCGVEQPSAATAHFTAAGQQQVEGAACSCSPHDSSRAFQQQYGLSKDQVERYSRQLLLSNFGIAAQGKLCSGSVLIVGCGGLGSPAALYLAAAGIGRLGLVDHDVVELSNMHRQIAHTEQRIGMHKALSAAAAVRSLNSSVLIDTFLEGLRPDNAVDILSQYDVVIDASDNPPTRYLINDACVACGIPLVSAAAVGTDGQLTVYNHAGGPCYRCLFPECPAAANCSRCADAGVLGPVPGVMGVLQATEAVKVLSGVGQVLAGKLLLYDALAGRFTTIKLRGKVAGCIACSNQAVISRSSVASYDYTSFTGGQQASDGAPTPLEVLPAQQRITAKQLHDRLAEAAAAPGTADESSSCDVQQQPLLLDVRPPEQFTIMSLPGAVNVPYLQFDQRFHDVLQLCGLEQRAAAVEEHSSTTQGPAPAPALKADGGTAPDNSSSDNNGTGQGGGAVVTSRPVYVMCRRGNHSQLAVERLHAAGVCVAVDVVGGYESWAAQVDDGMPTL